MGVAGGLALVWASLGAFGAITSAVNEAWGVEKQRSWDSSSTVWSRS